MKSHTHTHNCTGVPQAFFLAPMTSKIRTTAHCLSQSSKVGVRVGFGVRAGVGIGLGVRFGVMVRVRVRKSVYLSGLNHWLCCS